MAAAAPAFSLGALLRAAVFGCVLLPAMASQAAPLEPSAVVAEDAALIEQGRKIYVEGLLPGGGALKATRASGEVLRGQDAACSNCHRASGMGSVEGNLRVAPISSRFLFAQHGDMPLANADGIRGKSLSQAHEPYSEATLAQALGSGVNISGRKLSVLMPHFDLVGDDLRALTAYLSVLSRDYSVGVSKELIRFATVITPEVSAQRRAVFKQMLQSAVLVKNTSTSPRKRYMTSAASFVTQSERRWEVDIWELTGAPSTWAAQLDARYEAKPVFALLSGLSDGTWDPVDAFCSRQHVPCWFPSARAPAPAQTRYGLYFSNGVVLDAQVLAAHLQAQGGAPAARLTQVFVPDTAGAVAAATFRQALDTGQPAPADVQLGSAGDKKLAAVLKDSRRNDALLLWLGPEQLLPVLQMAPVPQAAVYIASPLWSDTDLAKIPPPWASHLLLVYPYERPLARQANLAYLHTWLKLREIPLVDEVLQSELFFSLNLMTDTLQDMIDNMFRDYLVERAEDNIGKRETSKAEQENRDRKALGRVARASVQREAVNGSVVLQAPDAQAAQQRAFGLGESFGTTVYPKLTLGPGQHFASRGAYVLPLSELWRTDEATAPPWVVP